MISSLTTLTTLICKTTLKIISSLKHANYTDFQGYIKNNFINDYTDYYDLQDYITNNFIVDYADHTDLQDYIKKNSSLTTLTTLIN